jgi:hypothetical protein
MDAAKGMLYLHSHNPAIMHRDLKSPNLLVSCPPFITFFAARCFWSAEQCILEGQLGAATGAWCQAGCVGIACCLCPAAVQLMGANGSQPAPCYGPACPPSACTPPSDKPWAARAAGGCQLASQGRPFGLSPALSADYLQPQYVLQCTQEMVNSSKGCIHIHPHEIHSKLAI